MLLSPLTANLSEQEICANEAYHLNIFNLPSRYRRKKGYNGKTAQKYNKNCKSMPKDF